MDFADAPEHAAFRREFRDWLEANLSGDTGIFGRRRALLPIRSGKERARNPAGRIVRIPRPSAREPEGVGAEV